jgi:TnpA family transposase
VSVADYPEPRRWSGILLPEDPGEEELAWNWTLSEADKREATQCRGDENRRRFALQLCVLRRYGRLLEGGETAPVRIANHLGVQLELPPVLFADGGLRPVTEKQYADRVRRYLGWRGFDSQAQHELAVWVEQQTLEGFSLVEVSLRAEQLLLGWQVVLPRAAVFTRLLQSLCRRAEKQVFARIAEQLAPAFRKEIDRLLEVPESAHRSDLFHLKTYPPEGKPDTILSFLANYHYLHSIGVAAIRLVGCTVALLLQFSKTARREDVWHLRRLPEAKRHALTACFLVEALKITLDHSVEMNDQFLGGMCRRSKNSFERKQQEYRRRARDGRQHLLRGMEIVVEGDRQPVQMYLNLYAQIPKPELRAAMADCRESDRLEVHGYADELNARVSHLKRYQPRFFELPFEAQPGSESTLTALGVARKLDSGELKGLPADAPVGFVAPNLRAPLRNADGSLKQRTWEIALGLAVRDNLRSGDLYLAESRKHGQFWNLVYEDSRWSTEREQGYSRLSLPARTEPVLQHLELELDRVANKALDGLPANPFAAVQNGRLKLKQSDAPEIPDSTKELRRLFESSLQKIRIEHLLRYVDGLCRFTDALRFSGKEAPSKNVLLAALIAHGTNLGISAMGHSAEGITVDMLQYASQWFLSEETLKAANKILVDYHHSIPLASIWGTGRRSSSDGQRFAVRQSSMLGSFCPRYFGYYDQAISVYTHTSDQMSTFSNQVISCRSRESLYVLSGLLLNDTILQPERHHVDTGGYTEHLFALCHLLGIEFMPRIKDLADQQLYKLNRDRHYGSLDELFRGTVDWDLIREQWDQMVRVAVALKNRNAPPEVVVQRLASAGSADRLAKALTAYGRIIKTIYILRYIQEEDLRRGVQLQLNRGEHRHILAKWLFFANRGEFRDGDINEIMNKTSCLSLLSNAVVIWNTIHMQKIVDRLRATGQAVKDEDLARNWPLLHAHIIPNGMYDFSGC